MALSDQDVTSVMDWLGRTQPVGQRQLSLAAATGGAPTGGPVTGAGTLTGGGPAQGGPAQGGPDPRSPDGLSAAARAALQALGIGSRVASMFRGEPTATPKTGGATPDILRDRLPEFPAGAAGTAAGTGQIFTEGGNIIPGLGPGGGAVAPITGGAAAGAGAAAGVATTSLAEATLSQLGGAITPFVTAVIMDLLNPNQLPHGFTAARDVIGSFRPPEFPAFPQSPDPEFGRLTDAVTAARASLEDIVNRGQRQLEGFKKAGPGGASGRSNVVGNLQQTVAKNATAARQRLQEAINALQAYTPPAPTPAVAPTPATAPPPSASDAQTPASMPSMPTGGPAGALGFSREMLESA